jgi:hypothetical protein
MEQRTKTALHRLADKILLEDPAKFMHFGKNSLARAATKVSAAKA